MIGRNVAVNTLGAHAEFILREYLKRGGLSDAEVKEVTLVAIRWTCCLRKTSSALSGGGLVKYWKSPSIASPGGVIHDRDMQMWIDFMARDGSLEPKQVAVADLFTNELNPYRLKAR